MLGNNLKQSMVHAVFVYFYLSKISDAKEDTSGT